MVSEEYESEPSVTINRADGSTLRFFRRKDNPYTFLPLNDDGTVWDMPVKGGNKK